MTTTINHLAHQHKFYNGGRCLRCQIKQEYMDRGLSALDEWPRAEKDERWANQVLGLLTCPAEGSGGWKGPDKSIDFRLSQSVSTVTKGSE